MKKNSRQDYFSPSPSSSHRGEGNSLKIFPSPSVGRVGEGGVVRNFYLNFFVIITIIFFIFPLAALAQSHSTSKDAALSEFVKAGMAYKDGNYPEAIKFYENILHNDLESGPLYYNLANSYFKQGALGKAILNYERAAQFIPRDSDLRANFQYALSQVKNHEAEAPRTIWQKIWEYHAAFYTVDEMTMILFLFVVLTALWQLLSLYFSWPSKSVRWGLLVLAVLFLIYGNGFLEKLESESDKAVVINATPAKFEPRDAATVHFELPEGSKVKVLKREGLWLKVARPDGNEGWAPKANVENIKI